MGIHWNCKIKYDCIRIYWELRKEQQHEQMRQLREKWKREQNVETRGGDKEMKSVKEHIDEINEEDGGYEEMIKVEGTIGITNIDTLIGY